MYFQVFLSTSSWFYFALTSSIDFLENNKSLDHFIRSLQMPFLLSPPTVFTSSSCQLLSHLSDWQADTAASALSRVALLSESHLQNRYERPGETRWHWAVQRERFEKSISLRSSSPSKRVSIASPKFPPTGKGASARPTHTIDRSLDRCPAGLSPPTDVHTGSKTIPRRFIISLPRSFLRFIKKKKK